MNTLSINIGGKIVGPGNPCYVIAEIGSNHNNEYNMAIELIDRAADAGADAVKLQTFYARKHYSKYTPKILQFESKNHIDPYLLIESLEMNREWIPKLSEYAYKKQIHLLSSPCDFEAINLLSSIDAPAYKVASFDVTDLKLIGEIAKKNKPVILSTGMASLCDIERAVNECYTHDNRQVILLQCTSLYPAPALLSNLWAMHTMKGAFNVVTGYSDHTLGDHVCIAAVSLGASVLEKHFTLSVDMKGPDHSFAIEPDELKSMIIKIRNVELALGDGIKNGPRPEEMELYEKARRSLHATVNLKQGELITESMLCTKRPGYGIEPYLIKNIIGRKVKRSVKADHWITWEDIE